MGGRIIRDRVYNLKEASKVLQVPTSTFRKMLHRGEIRGKKAGRRWVFLGEDLYKLFGRSQGSREGGKSEPNKKEVV